MYLSNESQLVYDPSNTTLNITKYTSIYEMCTYKRIPLHEHVSRCIYALPEYMLYMPACIIYVT